MPERCAVKVAEVFVGNLIEPHSPEVAYAHALPICHTGLVANVEIGDKGTDGDRGRVGDSAIDGAMAVVGFDGVGLAVKPLPLHPLRKSARKIVADQCRNFKVLSPFSGKG